MTGKVPGISGVSSCILIGKADLAVSKCEKKEHFYMLSFLKFYENLIWGQTVAIAHYFVMFIMDFNLYISYIY